MDKDYGRVKAHPASMSSLRRTGRDKISRLSKVRTLPQGRNLRP